MIVASAAQNILIELSWVQMQLAKQIGSVISIVVYCFKKWEWLLISHYYSVVHFMC